MNLPLHNRTLLTLSILGLILIVLAHGTQAQTITLQGPSSPVAIADGSEFATDVLENPWNLDRLRDIAMDGGFLQPTVNAGVWEARSSEAVAYYQPLFTGYSYPGYTVYFSRYDEGTPYGPLNPLNASKYKRLSMRTSLPQSARSSLAVFWTTDYAQFPAYDGLSLGDTLPAVEGFRITDVDLTGAPSPESAPGHAPQPAAVGKPWGGTVYGLLLRPSLSIPNNTLHRVDWIRLYDPATSPTLDLTWSTSGVPADGTWSVQVFADTNSSGFDGDLLASGLSNDGRFTLRTAALPPGRYYFYLRLAHMVNGSLVAGSLSGYSAPLDILAPPGVRFLSPSFTSGEEYSASALANAWDMSAAGDVASWSDVLFPTTQNGLFTALAGTTDPQVHLNLKRNGSTVPIDPRKYRYLSFRMMADHTPYLNFSDRIARGWVARLVWWNSSLSVDGSLTKDIPILEGWHRYTVDLWDSSLLETAGPPGTPQKGWRSLSEVRALRLDPLENYVPTWFNIDDVTLCAENRPANDSYTIRWNLQDADSAQCTLRLFARYDRNGVEVEDPTPIAVLSQPPGEGSYVWQTASMPNGQYYIRAEVTDGTHSRSIRSFTPIVIDDSYPRMNVSGCDPTIYYKPKGWWITLYPGEGYEITEWGHRTALPVARDYDGDGADDFAVFHPPTGNWHIRQSSNGQTLGGGPQPWGWNETTPVPADYDGDGKADLAVYYPATGGWYIRQSSNGQTLGGGPQPWGWSETTPVPADYDGDGKADLAVFHPATGSWYIRQSSNGQTLGGGPQAWGWNETTPVPADYDGDDRADIAVFHGKTGDWYIRRSSDGQTLGGGPIRWGAAGSLPVPGDFDRDGTADIVAYEPGPARWQFRFSSGGTESAAPWGWNGLNSVPIAGNFNGQ